MESPDAINDVAKFHKTFHHPILENPQIPDNERAQLRVELLEEELNELKIAIKEKNLVEVADALCDIQYVLSGAILEFGLGNKFKELFTEVQRSNMSKACKNIEEAEKTVAHYEEKGFPAYYKQDGDVYLVFRKADNKTLKSINYSPADLEKILSE